LSSLHLLGAGPARAGESHDHFEAPFTRAPLRTVIDARSTYDLGNITVYTRTIGLASGIAAHEGNQPLSFGSFADDATGTKEQGPDR
jgi:hypothetical protein